VQQQCSNCTAGMHDFPDRESTMRNGWWLGHESTERARM
jgi:hypothetical protein